MKMFVFGVLAALPAALSAQQTPAPATPPAAAPAAQPSLTAGQTVYDAAGGQVGTIDSVNGATVVVSTGTNKVGLAATAFAAGPNGPVIGSTKAELDAAASKAAAASSAQLQALLVAGSPVHGAAGASVGTVKSADDQFVTLTTANGDVRLPVSAFGTGLNGLVIGLTAAQLNAAMVKK